MKLRLRFFICISAVPLMAANCNGPATTVDVAASLPEIHSGQPSVITATVMQQPAGAPAPAPAPASTVKFEPAGNVSPASRGSDVQGQATTTFTGPVVDRNTTFTITAEYGSTTGSTDVVVKPTIASAQFASSTTPDDDVTITPSVYKDAKDRWVFEYVVQDGAAAPSIRTISVSFEKPVTLSSDDGSINPLTGQHRNFAVTAHSLSDGMTGPITITAKGDIEPGGTARWDVLDLKVRHANLTTTGPKQ